MQEKTTKKTEDRANSPIKIQDESGDRNYFTIIPNYILNHSTAVAQALYLQLKRLAGERGVAYPASRYLMDKLGISRNTLKKEFAYLLEKKWIRYAGEVVINTPGGQQMVKAYKIIDLWKINHSYYAGGVKIDAPRKRGVKIDAQGVSKRGVKIDAKEEPLEQDPLQEDPYVANATFAPSKKKKKYKKYDDPTPMSLEEFILWTESSPQRQLQIISQYADEKKPGWTTKGQWYAFIDRNVVAARMLSPYTTEQIEQAFLQLKEAQGDYLGKWHLNTLLKYLDPVD